MLFIVEALLTFKNILCAFFVSWFRFFVTAKYKCVAGEVVLVTGAASGMGRQIAKEFAKRKAQLVLWDIDESGLAETAKAIIESGGTCSSYKCDVSNRNQVTKVACLVRSEVGEVTILVNNAAVVAGKTILELKDEEIDRTFAVNLLAFIWTTKEFLPSMLENNHGHVVNMSSSCGLIGLSHLTDYSASKFGVVGFTEVLDYEIHFSGHDGVHTTLVCPSHVKTGLFNGCHMAYPLILPDLELEPTVDRIMQAILTNQKQVYMPRLVYIMSCLKTVMPVSGMLEVIRFFRADKFMDSFKGRSKDDVLEANKEK